jgi:hypothetical protein
MLHKKSVEILLIMPIENKKRLVLAENQPLKRKGVDIMSTPEVAENAGKSQNLSRIDAHSPDVAPLHWLFQSRRKAMTHHACHKENCQIHPDTHFLFPPCLLVLLLYYIMPLMSTIFLKHDRLISSAVCASSA